MARWAVVSAARRCSSYLRPIKAEKVPESKSASNNLICKSKVPVRGADVDHNRNDGSHGTVIESTATICLPVVVDIGASKAFENWEHGSGHQAYVLDMTFLSLFKPEQPTRKQK